MADDGITNDVRAREDDYFRKKDRELVERMRQAAAAGEARKALEASSGIHDPEMLQELEALGFTPDTIALLPVVPIVEVAWAEGGVSDSERAMILEFARERGVQPGSAAGQQLELWLSQRPPEEVFARATRLIRTMLDQPGGAQALSTDDLIQRCEAIAAASGGILGFGKISGEERVLLGRIQSALKAR